MRCWGTIALGLAVAVAAAAPAHAQTTATSVVMYSDTGDYIGGGTPRVWTPQDGSVAVSGTAGDLTVAVSGGASGDYFDFEFAAPPGQTLQPGIYDRAQRAPFRTAGHPGIDISGSGRGCNTDSGRFEVRDLATDASGKVTRLWLVYEQHCEGGSAATWGEVRIAEPVPDGPVLASPSIVRWPVGDLGHPRTTVPVTLSAAGATSVGSVAITGADPGDFVVRDDGCSAHSLAAGDGCQVWVRFVPTAAGTRTATLHVAYAGGGTRDVLLQGWSYGGTTAVTMHSDSGDSIGEGRDWSYGPADSISAGGSRQGVSFGVTGADGSWWSADFVPGDGDIIAPGTYANAHRYPFNGSGPGMDVSGNGHGCNEISGSFTVEEATFDSDGNLRTASISFEQHCDNATPALHGRFQFRAGDQTPVAPWMTAGGPTSDTPGGTAPGSTPDASTTTPPSGTDTATATPPPAAAPAPAAASSQQGSPAVRRTVAAHAPALARDLRAWQQALRKLGHPGAIKAARAATRVLRADLAALRKAVARRKLSTATQRRGKALYVRGLAHLDTALAQFDTMLVRAAQGRRGGARAAGKRALAAAKRADRDIRSGETLLGLQP